jgi:hypothetical protein
LLIKKELKLLSVFFGFCCCSERLAAPANIRLKQCPILRLLLLRRRLQQLPILRLLLLKRGREQLPLPLLPLKQRLISRLLLLKRRLKQLPHCGCQ